MGQLIIRAASAGVGFLIGGPTGAQIGWALGGLFAGAPDKVTRVQGPTLDDLRVYGTEYGQAIAWARGSFCTAGQVWWNSNKQPYTETRTTTQRAGKGGGGSQTTVEEITLYKIDVLIGFNELELDEENVGIRRMWDSGGLFYTAADGADLDSLSGSQDTANWDSFTFYPGNGTQLPDPDYETAVGVGHAPAYRHRSYAFIKGLKLGMAPAQLRNITFEVVRDGEQLGSADWTLRLEDAPTNSGQPSSSVAIGNTAVFAAAGNTYVTTDQGQTWTEYSPRGSIAAGGQNLSSLAAASTSEIICLEDGGHVQTSDTNGTTWKNYGVPGSPPAPAFQACGGSGGAVAYDHINEQYFAVSRYNAHSLLGQPAGHRSDTPVGSAVWAVRNHPDFRADQGWHDVCFGDGVWLVISTNLTNVLAVTAEQICHTDDPGLIGWEYESTPGGNKPLKGCCFAGEHTFIIVASTGEIYRSVDDCATWEIVSGAPSLVWNDVASNGEGVVLAVADNTASSTNAYISFDFGATWEQTTMPFHVRPASVVYMGTSGSAGRFAAMGRDGSGPTQNDQNLLTLDFTHDQITRNPPTVEEVCAYTLTKARLIDGYNFDVSALSTITRPVYSLPVSQMGPARTTLDVLMTAYFIECRVSDKIYLVPRGGASVKTIPYEDLGAGLGRGNYNPQLHIDSANDIEVMAQYAVMFRNYSFDYQRGVEFSDRQTTAVPGTIEEVTIPMGFPPSEAKIIADAIALDKATSPFRSTLFLLSDHADLEPADVITVLDEDSNPYRMRVLEKNDDYPLITLAVAVESAIIITSSGITDEDYEESINISGVTTTEALYLDIPMLTDFDNDIGFYVAGRGDDTTKVWPGFTLNGSDNDVDYTAMTALSNPTKMGFAVNGISIPLHPNSMFDEKNVLTVNVGSGVTLTSSTMDAVLGSEQVNAILSGSELMQYVTATPVSDGVYALSRLLRGRKGTDWAVATHVANERFVLLEPNRITRASLLNSQLGVSRFYKAVTFDRDISTVTAEEFTTNGISRKPYSPANLRVERDGSNNAALIWEHRSRFSTRIWGDLGPNVPLGENIEKYEVDIYSDNTFTTIVHTETELLTPRFEYSAADQTGDGLTPGNQINARIYQISDVVGRGYYLQGTV